MKREKVLGVPVDMVNKQETIEIVESWLKQEKLVLGGLRQVITAYSEFFVRVKDDDEFRRAWKKADLVVADGVGVLAAVDYKKKKDVLGVVWRGLRGQLGETVTGVWLTEELVRLAAEKDWRIFLLGGINHTAGRLAKKLKSANSSLHVDFDRGEKRLGEDEDKNRQVIKKINKFEPDILLVVYGPVKQEKWIFKHRKDLKAKLAIGVGGTFNEILGDFPRVPRWMEKRGLKWLWRLIKEPRRWKRIWLAVVVFPWMLFKDR